jgi:YVTN family beta-propeller protein
MSNRNKILCSLLLAFSVVILWRDWVIVIGQSQTPVLVVVNKNEATMSIIEPVEMKLLGKVGVGDGPHEVVLSADGKTAFVANYGAQTPGNSISVIDIASKKELRRVDISPLMRPHGLQEIGGKIYFTAETNRLIGRFDPATDKVDWMMGTGQNGSHMVVGSLDQKRFYTANIGSDTVTAFEFAAIPPAGSKVTHFAVGKQPEAIDLSPDGKEVWVGLNAEGSVDVVDTATGKVSQKINLNGRPYRVRFTPDGKTVVATMPNSKELILIDAASKKETKRIQLESVALGIIFSKDGKTAFVTAAQPDIVLKIDLEKGIVTGKTESGQVPDGVAVFGF